MLLGGVSEVRFCVDGVLIEDIRSHCEGCVSDRELEGRRKEGKGGGYWEWKWKWRGMKLGRVKRDADRGIAQYKVDIIFLLQGSSRPWLITLDSIFIVNFINAPNLHAIHTITIENTKNKRGKKE
jgi:hypothetical protein